MENSDLQKAIESINQSVKRLVETIIPQMDFMKDISAKISKIIGPIATHVGKMLEEHELNIKTGWWYPNFIVDDLPAATIHEALKNEPDKKTFTKLVVKECSKDDSKQIHDMLLRWQSYVFLKPRRKQILEDIIVAHLDKKYTLSTPVAMSQIDYLYHALFPEKSEVRFVYKNMDAVLRGQQINFARHFGEDDYKRVSAKLYFELYPVYHYFKNVLFASKNLRSFQKVHNPEMYRLSNPNNRHAILHGENTNYAYEARSLKQILLIDKILFNICKIHEEASKTKRKGYSKGHLL